MLKTVNEKNSQTYEKYSEQINLLALSISHQTANERQRDRLAFTAEQKSIFEQAVISEELATECFVLSTCNRTEIYFAILGEVNSKRINLMQRYLSNYKGLDLGELKEICNIYSSGILTRHLMRVACGLDSMLIGEDQIKGQLKDSFLQSQERGYTGKNLQNLFQAVQHCAALVRSQTALSGTPWSIPSLAIKAGMSKLLEKKQGSQKINVLVIGASGYTGQIIIRDLLTRYGESVYVMATCRSHCAPLSMMSKVHSQLELVEYKQRYDLIDSSDLIISATRSPHLTIKADLCQNMLNNTRKRVFVDLAMPMDIDENITKLPDCSLIQLDQVKELAQQSNSIRYQAAIEAADIIEEQADNFEKSLLMRQKKKVIEQIINQADKSGHFYQPDEMMRYLIYNVRDNASREEFEIFLNCLDKGFDHKALGRRVNKKQKRSGTIRIVGFGPGSQKQMTHQSYNALSKADYIVGYKTYTNLLKPIFPEHNYISSGMRQETARCQKALDLAAEGYDISLVSSGDSGIYGMAGILLQLLNKHEKRQMIKWEVVPGVTAANAAAAVLGAPLMHDFAIISLSDLLTPMELIEKRLEAAASSDFVICLYNPASSQRLEHLAKAVNIISKYRLESTPVGIVTHAGRSGQHKQLTTLCQLPKEDVNMFSVVLIGNSQTFVENNIMITPRGYKFEEDI